MSGNGECYSGSTDSVIQVVNEGFKHVLNLTRTSRNDVVVGRKSEVNFTIKMDKATEKGSGSGLSLLRQRLDDLARHSEPKDIDFVRQQLQDIEGEINRCMDPIDDHFMDLVSEINSVEIFFARRKVDGETK